MVQNIAASIVMGYFMFRVKFEKISKYSDNNLMIDS